MSSDPTEAPEDIRVALVLQGGGARGAYQWGVYEALADAGLEPDWTMGISSGALNAAVIATNRQESRRKQLEALWRSIESPLDPTSFVGPELAPMARSMASLTSTFGARGFYRPRPLPPFAYPPGSPGATSLYSNAPLERVLKRVTDFDGFHARRTNTVDRQDRLSLGATDAATGALTFFDSTSATLGLEHVLASGALPPGAAGRTIDGRLYWDGGLAANSPLDYFLGRMVEADYLTGPTLLVIVDLWWVDEKEPPPQDLAAVSWRKNQVAYVSKAEQAVQRFRRSMHFATNELILHMSGMRPDEDEPPGVPLLVGKVLGLHLKYGRTVDAKPLGPVDFSRTAIELRREAGREEMRAALAHSDAITRLRGDELFGEIRGYTDGAFDGEDADLRLPLVQLYRLHDQGKLPPNLAEMVAGSSMGRYHLTGRPPPSPAPAKKPAKKPAK